MKRHCITRRKGTAVKKALCSFGSSPTKVIRVCTALLFFFLHPGCISKQQEAWRYDPRGRFILIARSSRENTRDALAPGFTGSRRRALPVLILSFFRHHSTSPRPAQPGSAVPACLRGGTGFFCFRMLVRAPVEDLCKLPGIFDPQGSCYSNRSLCARSWIHGDAGALGKTEDYGFTQTSYVPGAD